MKELSEGRSFDLSELTGQHFPWRRDCEQPRLIDIEGTPYVPVFESKDALDALMAVLHITDYKVKTVADGPDFVSSIHEANVRVCFDVWSIDKGDGNGPILRYTEIRMNWPSEGDAHD